MVDEYDDELKTIITQWRRSDSSMVDEYQWRLANPRIVEFVQIPLWSMNTNPPKCGGLGVSVQIPLWSMNTLPRVWTEADKQRSDSSMVDEYNWKVFSPFSTSLVQIPLWSMNTRR